MIVGGPFTYWKGGFMRPASKLQMKLDNIFTVQLCVVESRS